MLKKSNSQQTNKEDHENKLLIEKWMKRNCSNKVVIGKDVEKSNRSESKTNNIAKCNVNISEKKKVVIPIEISESKLNRLTNLKQRHSLPMDNNEPNAPKAKVSRQSLPNKDVSVYKSITPKLSKPSIEIIPTKAGSKFLPRILQKSPTKTIPIIEVIKTTNNIIDNEVSTPNVKCKVEKSSSIVTGNQMKQNLSLLKKSNVIEVSSSKGNQIVKHSSPSTTNYNIANTSMMKGATSTENVGTANNEANSLLKKKEKDVYILLLENYRYLIIPRDWSVNEFTNETRNRYIVFFKTRVIEEKNILISVIIKSLIIDKQGTIHYSVHGLPIETKGTILPKTLDSTKKLLSILHIFDKMQVCEGLGSDLDLVQNSFIYKDCCRYWRHKDCKIILIKAFRCSECTHARDEFIKWLEPQINAIKEEIEFVDVSVKNEISEQI